MQTAVRALLKILSWLALSLFLVMGSVSVYAAQSFAVVWRLDGELIADGAGGKRVLKLGDTVFVGERLAAGKVAEGVLKTTDAGLIAIRPGAQFRAIQFVAEGKASDTSQVELVKGSLRIVSGWIGKVNRQGSTVITPTATIGIRGTDHEPYVLPDEDEDRNPRYKPGTYDKVNRGGTTLLAAGQSVDIDPGKVGFARSGGKSRALMTLLFPVLLERVPDFYVPGKFDDEINEFSKTADANIEQELQSRLKQDADCVPQDVATRWVEQLDRHIVRGDASAILKMFAPDVRVKATVRGADGRTTELELDRQELVDSTVSAVTALTNYKHRRISLQGKSDQASSPSCGPVSVRSIVIEEGRQAGQPYRFEAEETYLLQRVDGEWRATRAETRQR